MSPLSWRTANVSEFVGPTSAILEDGLRAMDRDEILAFPSRVGSLKPNGARRRARGQGQALGSEGLIEAERWGLKKLLAYRALTDLHTPPSPGA